MHRTNLRMTVRRVTRDAGLALLLLILVITAVAFGRQSPGWQLIAFGASVLLLALLAEVWPRV
jgi:membrane-bound ClpP family serine protease